MNKMKMEKKLGMLLTFLFKNLIRPRKKKFIPQKVGQLVFFENNFIITVFTFQRYTIPPFSFCTINVVFSPS